MNAIRVGKIEDIEAFVKAMQVDVYCGLPNNHKSSYMAILKSYDIIDDCNYYRWRLMYKYK
jgi:hypothetical protein